MPILREHLKQVADEGIAFSAEEFMSGVAGVAAAFKVRNGATVAIGFVGPWNSRVVDHSSDNVIQAAMALDRALSR
jgi:DNA-binding IclR family transcriptional regulator